MKPSTLHICVLVICVFVSVAGAGCDYLKAPFSYYYSSTDGQKIPLILYSSEIGLRFLESTSEAERTAIVEGESILRYDGNHAYVVAGASDEEILEAIRRLSASAGVDWANPIVLRPFRLSEFWSPYYHVPVVIGRTFKAEFPASTAQDDIDALNEAYGIQVVSYARSGEETVTYTLRPTAETGFNTLEMANLYHEHALTIRAWPRTYPLMMT